MKTLLASLVAFSAVTALTQPPPIDYRFDDVKRKVILTTPKQELSVARGQHAKSGDRVETGWFAYALIASEQYRARFEIFSSTQVKLAEGTPGVLLSIDRGRIRAMFDKLVGSEPRVVKTPGALLAVRGTQFDVEVDAAGRTTVDVFDGIVEVRSDLLRQPLLVHPGEQTTFGRRDAPTTHPMPEDHRRNDPNRDSNRHPEGGDDQHGAQRGGEGQHQPPQQPPTAQPRGTRPPSPQPNPPSNPPTGHH
jgi:hypothetical protein